jgi:hypothetical protein
MQELLVAAAGSLFFEPLEFQQAFFEGRNEQVLN